MTIETDFNGHPGGRTRDPLGDLCRAAAPEALDCLVKLLDSQNEENAFAAVNSILHYAMSPIVDHGAKAKADRPSRIDDALDAIMSDLSRRQNRSQ